MEDEFRAFHQKSGATLVYVTHDQAEAMALAQQIAVMDKGRLVQVADPQTLYREPATNMVAGFIGKSAVADAEVLARTGAARCRARVFGAEIELRCRDTQALGAAKVCLRPEDIALGAAGITGTVRRATYKGGVTEIEVAPTAAPEVLLLLSVTAAPAIGSNVAVNIADGWVIPN
jgi:iron(III) transport system ATP-binding protein